MSGSRGDGPSAAGSGPSHEGPRPDGHHDDLDAREVERLNVEIPDDASELDTDREAWLAEVAFEEDAAGPLAATPGSAWAVRRASRRRRLVITAGIVLASMLVVAFSGAVGAWLVGPQTSQNASPLARTGPEPGQIGGLLPRDVVLETGEADLEAQSIRPAVIALVPAGCLDCEQLMSTIAPQVGSFGLSLVAVAGPGQDDQLATLSDIVGANRLVTLTDPEEQLRSVYGLTGLTLLLVRADGVVVDILRDPPPNLRLESALVNLVPGVGADT
ncbi:MAG TPA: hypothetical protein VFX15_09595 [Actinomycetes bacterium]|nr:hypothetical protein [Actinomycetes bacterium]